MLCRRFADSFAMRQSRLTVMASWTRQSTSSILKVVDQLRLGNEDDARVFVGHLNTGQRELLERLLREHRGESRVCLGEQTTSFGRSSASASAGLVASQLRRLALVSALPFVGFGMLDNIIMILAGEWIDVSLGAALTISTMAAAALGNVISDVSGLTLANYVELLVARFGIRAPTLTPRQKESSRARLTIHMGRVLGLVVGCLLGMFPLLFFNGSSSSQRSARISSHVAPSNSPD